MTGLSNCMRNLGITNLFTLLKGRLAMAQSQLVHQIVGKESHKNARLLVKITYCSQACVASNCQSASNNHSMYCCRDSSLQRSKSNNNDWRDLTIRVMGHFPHRNHHPVKHCAST